MTEPKKGMTVFYKGEPQGKVVLVQDNLCFVDHGNGEDPMPFIWRFTRLKVSGGLDESATTYNTLHTWRFTDENN